MARGVLRIYLGAAPGVGKTYAMLGEGHRRADRGTDVVVGFVEPHGRRLTAQMAEGLEAVPRQVMSYRGTTFEEMDVDAVLARKPTVALVDELAHTNVPGSRNEKRWQDVEELLEAGIDVITTLNIQHLESLNDVVESITGVKQRETIPDEVVRRADQIELEDMTAQALRRRLAHGNVYAPEKIDAALSHYFREGNLTALRELALLWLADRVDEGLTRYRTEHGIAVPWPARERVVVALAGGPEGETLVRRAARIASRGAGGELLAVYVARSDGILGASPEATAVQRRLVEGLGGTFHTVVGDDVASALLEFARGVNASQLVVGVSRRGRLRSLLVPGVSATVVQDSGDIDVHLVTHEYVGRVHRRTTRQTPALGRRRLLGGWALALLGPPLLTLVLANTRALHALPTELLLFLTLVVGAALVGGLWPAVVAAVVGSMQANFWFTPPYHTFTIARGEDAFALVIFVFVGVAVAMVVDLAARRTAQAARARAESETLSALASSVLRGQDALASLLDGVRHTFGMTSASLLERAGTHEPWRCAASSGEPVCVRPEEADVEVQVAEDLVLALTGRVLPAGDRRMLEAFAAQAAVALQRQRLAQEAVEARRQIEGNAIRTALLAAVSHDLRTPLASIKAAASSLRQTDVSWSSEDQAELLATVEESADRLNHLVGNLLDVSRLRTGGVTPLLRPVALDEVVPTALAGLPDTDRVSFDPAGATRSVVADPGLLERVIANVVENALRYSGPGRPVSLLTSGLADQVELRIVDRGPGVPDPAKERIFEPFQRWGDVPGGLGVGLGLAVARGFTEAMDGTLTAEDTPGGGLTVVLALPAAPAAAAPPPEISPEAVS